MPKKSPKSRLIGVLALQGAFEEHETKLRSLGPHITTRQVKTPSDLSDLDGIVLPGGESSTMSIVGSLDGGSLWDALRDCINVKALPCWGTCAGMILLADKAVGTSATIEGGQALIGGLDVIVCRNYFGSQISSFEMETPAPPGSDQTPFNGVFIRAPAILQAGPGLEVLTKIVATPHSQANSTLRELDARLAKGEDISASIAVDENWYKNEPAAKKAKKGVKAMSDVKAKSDVNDSLTLPGAAPSSDAREIIIAVKKGNVLATSFHPELCEDLRWHEYWMNEYVEKK